MRKMIYIFLLLVNSLLAFLLLLSYLSTHISPSKIWPLAFFGLGYQYLLIVNFIFIIFWIIKLKKAVFISLIVIIIGWNHHRNYIPLRLFISGKSIEETDKLSKLRILSYNVRAFNVYEWLDDNKTSTNIYNLIRSESPDIICLQEYYSADHHSRITKLIPGKVYSHIFYSSNSSKTGNFGIATYSRYPVINKGLISSPNTSNVTIYSDILVASDTFRIYNNHLQSLNFKQSNYDFIDSLRFRYDEKNLNEIMDITGRLKTAFVKRSAQVDLVSAHIKNCPYPVIVCGDFNDTPVSYTYRKMRTGLKDSFVSSGTGFGNTYLGIFPSFRIDYIFHSSFFETIEFERVKAKLSDHYPIICRLGYSSLKNEETL